ncbi:MAG TPA: DUF1992 domain-containing protein [Anaerolineales bacterium]|nr:DUF1992 domain-containing protein [Anaerolineales bacterium]
MSMWRRWAERKIEEAMQDGAFDDLPGRGRRLALDDEALVPEEWRLAFRVLRRGGFAPAWIELRKEAEARLLRACDDLRDAAREHQGDMEPGWIRARLRFTDEIKEVNQLIDRANLEAGRASLQLPHCDAARLAEKIRRQAERS